MTETVVHLHKPLDWQLAGLNDPSRFKVFFCGRRAGKTDFGITALLVGTKELPGAARQRGLYWWIGLTWRSASMKRAWRMLKRACRGWCEIREADKEIRLPNGSEIWLRTAENPESLSGEGVRGVVFDEFTMASSSVWGEHVRPTLADCGGWAVFIGVPKGKNWGWQLWTRGAGDRKEPHWQSWKIPTAANPFIAASEIEEARNTTPQDLFAQEWLAEVVDDAGSVFRRVTEAATSRKLDDAVEGRRYVMGVDWGKQNDRTVITVVDSESGEVVESDAFNQIDYALQKPRVIAAYDRFKPQTVVAETNSMGEPLIEDLERADLPIERFTTTHASKALAIEALALAFERSEIKIPNDPDLIFELQAFGRERLPGGSFRYCAPDGMHDDRVMSLAFAWWGVTGGEGAGWAQYARDRVKRRSAA